MEVLDDTAFADALAAVLRDTPDNAEAWLAFTAADVIHRTRAVLSGWDRDVLAQLAQANTHRDEERARCLALGDEGRVQFAAYEAEQADWRRRAHGYRRLVLARLAQVKRAVAMYTAEDRAAHPPAPPGAGRAARRQNMATLGALARRVLSLPGGEDLLAGLTVNVAGAEIPLDEWAETGP
jgi:hypothetical protein